MSYDLPATGKAGSRALAKVMGGMRLEEAIARAKPAGNCELEYGAMRAQTALR